MPTRENAFDFEDNPSGSDDKLPRISRRLKTPNTVASIVAMTGESTLAVGTMNDRNQRCNSRNSQNEEEDAWMRRLSGLCTELRLQMPQLRKMGLDIRLMRAMLESDGM